MQTTDKTENEKRNDNSKYLNFGLQYSDGSIVEYGTARVHTCVGSEIKTRTTAGVTGDRVQGSRGCIVL